MKHTQSVQEEQFMEYDILHKRVETAAIEKEDYLKRIMSRDKDVVMISKRLEYANLLPAYKPYITLVILDARIVVLKGNGYEL